jgi:hypothetical protein
VEAYPDRYVHSIGSMGEFVIQPCPEGKEVGEPLRGWPWLRLTAHPID